VNLDGSQLARAMMSIHEAEMEQSARYPGSDLSERLEQRIMLRQRANRTPCWVGGLVVSLGRRLHQHGLPQPLPLEDDAAQLEGTRM
jgi:hypothetical protein